MANFFKSFFSSSSTQDGETEETKTKNDQKNFDILKYDGIRAQRIGKISYAVKCFTEALNIQEDYETMGYLVSAYTANSQLEEALQVVDRMIACEPAELDPLLSRVNLLFMLDRDAEAIDTCQQMIALAPDHHIPPFLLAKAKKTTGDLLGAVADLTRSIALKEDFPDAYLLRAELLLTMKQGQEALADIEAAITLVPEEETAYLLRGRIHELLGDLEAATKDYRHVTDLNPFNEEGTLLAGQLLITRHYYAEAIAFFDEAIDANPDFAKAYAERGRAKNLAGDKEGAFADLKKSIELNPDGDEAARFNGQHSNFDNLYKGGIF